MRQLLGNLLPSSFSCLHLLFHACSIASRCVDAKNFGTALTLITKASDLAGNGEVFDRRAMQELKAYVNDSFAYFYYRRGKYEAALHYAQKAMQAWVLVLRHIFSLRTGNYLYFSLVVSFFHLVFFVFLTIDPRIMNTCITLGARFDGGLGPCGESALAQRLRPREAQTQRRSHPLQRAGDDMHEGGRESAWVHSLSLCLL